MIRCILFDRDGTLGGLQDDRYPASFQPYCDIKSVFTALKRKGYKVGVITNQSSVARGTGRGYDFDAEFRGYGADVWKICPHDKDDRCDCRKPKSGLVFAAAKELGIDPRECLIVGDRTSDILCALNAGAQAALVLTGKGESEKAEAVRVLPSVTVWKRFDEAVTALPTVVRRETMKLSAFTNEDFAGLYEFMRPLWHETYGGFLPKEQIDFLLDTYFSEAEIAHYRALGYTYRKIDDIGVVVFVDRGEYIYMDKLYLLPSARGKGYPAFVFGELAKFGKDIVLSANQRNARALRCYQKNGFVIEEEKTVELGNGMVNYDYILRKRI